MPTATPTRPWASRPCSGVKTAPRLPGTRYGKRVRSRKTVRTDAPEPRPRAAVARAGKAPPSRARAARQWRRAIIDADDDTG